jgi:putative phosphoserine phosphatase / 1-acylglycerol-3-phosphate O-acyltransferase
MSPTLPLEMALDEIETSPEGPSVGAFFDFDGTLIAGYSAMHLSQERMRAMDVSFAEVARTLSVGIRAGLGRAEFEDFLEVGAVTWKGRSDTDLRSMGDRVFERRVNDIIYAEARDLVRLHRARGHTVVVCSSATEYQVEPMARYLGIDHVLCNRYIKAQGHLTGDLCRPVIWGRTKASTVEQFARDHGVDMASSWFYADGEEDAALMRVVGRPRPTNPSKGLARVADDAGWPTLRFTSRSSHRTAGHIKQVASAGLLGAAAVGGGVVALRRRNRQAGADFVTRHWLSAVFAINGVVLCVTGEEHLRVPRPAVYVYNHRNNLDGFVAAYLVGRDFVAVGDREVGNHPLFGPLARFSGIEFLEQIDGDSPSAAESRLAALAGSGQSILVAPEGVRVDSTTVGQFEPNAFRIALAAGVPIVPIVITNADRIAGRTSSELVGGTVDVRVLPPVDVTGWTSETLDELVASVRASFLDALTPHASPSA